MSWYELLLVCKAILESTPLKEFLRFALAELATVLTWFQEWRKKAGKGAIKKLLSFQCQPVMRNLRIVHTQLPCHVNPKEVGNETT